MDDKKAILFIGLPASGKTTYIEKYIMGYRIVSADELKYANPEYDPNDPEKIHQWSVKEAEKLMNEYSDLGIDICMDSGGVNNSYSLRILNMLQSKGYYVEVIHMDTPLDVCLKRNSLREGSLPERIILEKAEKIDLCVEKQKALANKYTKIEYGKGSL